MTLKVGFLGFERVKGEKEKRRRLGKTLAILSIFFYYSSDQFQGFLISLLVVISTCQYHFDLNDLLFVIYFNGDVSF